MTTPEPAPDNLNGSVILVCREGMGQGPPDLQRKVLGTFLTLLLENGWTPTAICFYTEGVKLLAEDSPVLEHLQLAESRGIRLIGCKTCLDYFQIAPAIGIVGGMGDILAALSIAVKVITL